MAKLKSGFVGLLCLSALSACDGSSSGSASVTPQLLKLGTSQTNSASAKPVMILPARVPINWKSFTPTSVQAPIFSIALSGDGDSYTTVYSCSAQTNEDCLLEISNVTALEDVINAQAQDVSAGTYTHIRVSTCTDAGEYTSKVTSEVTLNGVRYITKSSGNGLVADPTSTAEEASVTFSGCSRDYGLPQAVTLADGDSVTLKLYYDVENIGWAAAGDSTTQNAWIPSGCSGTQEAASSLPFVCLSYPDVSATISTETPSLERWLINDHAILGLFFASNGVPLGGFTRRFYQEDTSYAGTFTPDTPLKTFSLNSDETSYTISNYGSTATGAGYFNTVDFERQTGHSGTFTDQEGSEAAYSIEAIE